MWMDYQNLNSKCVPLEIIMLVALVAALIAIFAAPALLVFASYISLLFGGAAMSSAQSSICRG